MSSADLDILLLDVAALHAIDIRLAMSHLACADEPAETLNAVQLERFRALRERFPGVPGSLANSAGIFLGPDFHFELVRPGAALFGLRVSPAATGIMPALSLHARIIQTRAVGTGEYVGYGKRYQALSPRRVATLSIGYADGVHRILTNRGRFHVGGESVPVVGTVSMDSVTIDVTGIDAIHLHPGTEVELIGGFQSADDVAADAGTIGYEILTSLGNRFMREYRCPAGD